MFPYISRIHTAEMFGDLFPINKNHGNLSASRGPVSPKDLTMSQAGPPGTVGLVWATYPPGRSKGLIRPNIKGNQWLISPE